MTIIKMIGATRNTGGFGTVDLEWILPVAPEVKVRVPKEKRKREKKRRPEVQRTNQRAMNMRRR